MSSKTATWTLEVKSQNCVQVMPMLDISLENERKWKTVKFDGLILSKGKGLNDETRRLHKYLNVHVEKKNLYAH